MDMTCTNALEAVETLPIDLQYKIIPVVFENALKWATRHTAWDRALPFTFYTLFIRYNF